MATSFRPSKRVVPLSADADSRGQPTFRGPRVSRSGRPNLLSYFQESGTVSTEDIDANLWNENANACYGDDDERQQDAILEQYKLYVEMADRVSARRALANTFFLTLNTAALTAIGVFWEDGLFESRWLAVFPLVVLVTQCLAWLWIVRCYRQLNRGKWAVIGALEKRLPASPWWRGEWVALGRGQDPARYWPLTQVERVVPLLFAASYLLGFAVVIFL